MFGETVFLTLLVLSSAVCSLTAELRFVYLSNPDSCLLFYGLFLRVNDADV